MAGDKLSELRGDLAQVYLQIEVATSGDEDADTTELENRANEIQDQVDAILDAKGLAIQQELRNRPRADPPPSPDRLL